MTPWAKMFYDPTTEDLEAFPSIKIFAIMLLVLVCSKVALLLFALPQVLPLPTALDGDPDCTSRRRTLP